VARRFVRPLRIRFAHCDPAGIVFYPQYLVLFNTLVEDWFDQGLGIPYASVLGPRRTGLPTVRLEVDFKAVSRMGEDVELGLSVERLGERSLTLALDLCAGDEVRVAARKVLVATSLQTHKAMPWPDDLRQAMQHWC